MMQHILIEAMRQMKKINATKADIIHVLRLAVDVLESRGK
jgi:hypothetical protein